jgi:hypothetical protein
MPSDYVSLNQEDIRKMGRLSLKFLSVLVNDSGERQCQKRSVGVRINGFTVDSAVLVTETLNTSNSLSHIIP